MTRTIHYKYIIWGIKLNCFIRQADLSYSQVYDDDGEEGEDDNVKNDNDKDDMNDKDNNDDNNFFPKYQVLYILRTMSSSRSEWWQRVQQGRQGGQECQG